MNTFVPFDTNLENGVLGALILTPEVYPKIRDFLSTDEVFHQKKSRMLWKKLIQVCQD